MFVAHRLAHFGVVQRGVILGVVVTLVGIVPTPNAFAARDPLADAQERITAAQEAANEAAAAYDAAQAHYYELQNSVRATQAAMASLRADQQELVVLVRQRAVSLYMGAGSTGLDFFRTSGDVLDTSRRVTLGAAANARADASIGQLRAATDDLDARERSLRSQLADAKSVLNEIRSQKRELQGAVDDATRAERQLRQQLERERRLEEYDALVRAAQARAAARARAEQADEAARRARESEAGPPSEPAPVVDEGPRQIIGSGEWICPVQGGVSFTDTYGAPRSGGRSHKGVDMFAALGTPTVAVVAGSVFFQSDPLGGLAAYVQGNDNNTYYYAHLDDYVGGGRSVSAGELIGHVGNTGAPDAPPHLHFEIRPGGPNGPRINPYPTVRSHC